jgi:GNAT superfamily N-acetyltransferase
MLSSANTFVVSPEDPASAVACQLLDELSATLAAITSATGRASFDLDDVRQPNALFVIARDATGQAVGCGGFRPLCKGIAEVKRMYARPGTTGTGAAILAYLEARAANMGYQALWLETRLVNERAVRFYEKHGYSRIPNFGKYQGNPQVVCFEKRLTTNSEQKIPPVM